jgi:hypothetical protein
MEAALSASVERRRGRRRRSVEEHGIVRARVRPGHEVDLIDVSLGGALVECVRRLLPGTLIELYLVAGDRSASVRGRVLRCAVVRLKATFISYRGAIGFDRDLPWFPDEATMGYAVHTETCGARSGREDVTPMTI